MAEYQLICQSPECNQVYQGNTEYRLQCDHEIQGHHGPALLKATYPNTQITLKDQLPGIFKYIDWLPLDDYYFSPSELPLSQPISYRSEGLAAYLGLDNLYIAFSGYWPERGARVVTRSFKEFEVQASLVRYLSSAPDDSPMPLIVSSAGNTANAYNLTAHQLGVPMYLVVPETGLDKLVLPVETHPYLITVKGDYFDAISVANELQAALGFGRDGGVKNVGRRAGMGTPVLEAVTTHGQLFDHYFQAVGSASGAIAAHEAVELLLNDGRFGNTLTQIHMVQNAPFSPIPDAWEAGRKKIVPEDENLAKAKISAVTAQVLTNRKPPYGLPGGIYDVLDNSDGHAWRAHNKDVFKASQTFLNTEGVEISAASAVAICGLEKAIEKGAVSPKDRVLLHITGGGIELTHSTARDFQVQPQLVLENTDIQPALDAIKQVAPIENATKYLKRMSGLLV